MGRYKGGSMSENESDVQRERATDDRDNVVLTGEEIELPR